MLNNKLNKINNRLNKKIHRNKMLIHQYYKNQQIPMKKTFLVHNYKKLKKL